jgi:hypothetical protein
MKERKYKDLKGLENLNTFTQFDQFESQRIHGGKNRFVYDFSFQTRPGLPDNFIFDSPFTTFLNISTTGYRSQLPLVSQYGYPGDEIEFASIESNASSGTVVPYTWGNYENTINTDEKTFVFDEKTIAYLDAARYETFTARTANWVDVFRSGYVEFTIKTNKSNMIIASGSQEVKVDDLNALFWIFGADLENGTSLTSMAVADTKISNPLVQIEQDKYISQGFDKALFNLDIKLLNGKLCVEYENAYDVNNTSFSFVGNKNIADNQWHHVVINFGRPGLIINENNKLNKRNIQIWVDGNLDKEFDEKINEFQIFYPSLVWLFNSPSKMFKDFFNNIELENNFDYHPRMSQTPGLIVNWANQYIGYDEFLSNKNIYKTALNYPSSIARGFKGAIHTYAHGINVPLSKKEIQQRHSLWKRETKRIHKAFTANAEIKSPIIQTNSKNALKLYWDDLVVNGKNGIELDKTYNTFSYSVINQTKNSKTEIFNLDKSNNKPYIILPNVRVVLTDHVVVFGPEKLSAMNKRESYSLNLRVGNETPAQFVPSSNNSLQTEVFDDSLIVDLSFSGIKLQVNDRILLTKQIDDSENGIWVYNGQGFALTRPTDAFIEDKSQNYIVYVSDGIYKNSYWKAEQYITSFNDSQRWSIINLENPELVSADPQNITRWKDYFGQNRLINLQDDLNINDFDLIVFMNYPETNEEIFDAFPNDPKAQVLKQYNDFIQSLKVACSNGANLYVSSPKLAEDMGIVSKFTIIDQEIEIGDGRSAVVNPFQFDEPATSYFDTHRQNAYHLDTEIPGLTDRETWIMTEAINYIPKDEYDYEQWHLKYSYRQFGLQEGNEFLIPSLAIRQVATKNDLPGFRANSRASSKLYVANPADVQAGVIVTSLANTHYHGSTIANNEYDDYATTIAIYGGDQLDGMPINGKIFVNCIEDGYTMSREEYNKGIIQVIPNDDPNETNARRQWQYSTSRLNRSPKRVNVRELTTFGQTTPTNGGGGPIVQSATNSSNGIIRSETDKNNKDYQSDLYPQETEEIYPIQEIPVLGMTWLGLKWLEG